MSSNDQYSEVFIEMLFTGKKIWQKKQKSKIISEEKKFITFQFKHLFYEKETNANFYCASKTNYWVLILILKTK
jgi:hypothetical protein